MVLTISFLTMMKRTESQTIFLEYMAVTEIWAETASEHTFSKAVVTHILSYDVNIQICQKSLIFAIFLISLKFSTFLHFPNVETGGG